MKQDPGLTGAVVVLCLDGPCDLSQPEAADRDEHRSSSLDRYLAMQGEHSRNGEAIDNTMRGRAEWSDTHEDFQIPDSVEVSV